MEKDMADYYITLSYLLHYYLQTKEKEKYEKYAKDYFGGYEDLEEQLIYGKHLIRYRFFLLSAC